MTGWCPIHDRVYDAEDSLCPRCGTALVADDPPDSHEPILISATTKEDADDVPAVVETRRRSTPVVWVGAAVVVAFVAGLAFPQVDRDAGPPEKPAEARSEINVGVPRTDSGLELRLESFSQQGSRIVARFTMKSAKAVGAVRSASVELIGPGGVVGTDVVEVRPTINGFILDAASLARPAEQATEVRLTALHFVFSSQAELPLDLAGVWPATAANEPRVRKIDERRRLGEGLAVRIRGLVGWQDRLEVALRFEDETGSRRYGYQFNLIMPFGLLPGSPAGLGFEEETVFFPFADVSRKLRETSLHIVVEDFSIEGDWRWTLVPG